MPIISLYWLGIALECWWCQARSFRNWHVSWLHQPNSPYYSFRCVQVQAPRAMRAQRLVCMAAVSKFACSCQIWRDQLSWHWCHFSWTIIYCLLRILDTGQGPGFIWCPCYHCRSARCWPRQRKCSLHYYDWAQHVYLCTCAHFLVY